MRNIVINGIVNENYFVDELGNIYNKEMHQMAIFISWNGYARVKLSRGVKRGMYLVHRIVAETYIPNPENLPIVNHLDSNRQNNAKDNLEWCDNSTNQKQRYSKNGYKGTKCKPVAQIDTNTGEILKVFESPIYAEKELGICSKNISKVCKGERNHAGGFKWQYV